MAEIRCPNPDCGHLESVHTPEGCKVQVCACKGMNPTFVELMTGLNALDGDEATALSARPAVTATDPFEASPGVQALMRRAWLEGFATREAGGYADDVPYGQTRPLGGQR